MSCNLASWSCNLPWSCSIRPGRTGRARRGRTTGRYPVAVSAMKGPRSHCCHCQRAPPQTVNWTPRPKLRRCRRPSRSCSHRHRTRGSHCSRQSGDDPCYFPLACVRAGVHPSRRYHPYLYPLDPRYPDHLPYLLYPYPLYPDHLYTHPRYPFTPYSLSPSRTLTRAPALISSQVRVRARVRVRTRTTADRARTWISQEMAAHCIASPAWTSPTLGTDSLISALMTASLVVWTPISTPRSRGVPSSFCQSPRGTPARWWRHCSRCGRRRGLAPGLPARA